MVFTIIGWAGMVTFLVAYGLVANQALSPVGATFNAMQVLGALCIAGSLVPVWRKSLPTIVLELVFVAIGSIAIFHAVVK